MITVTDRYGRNYLIPEEINEYFIECQYNWMQKSDEVFAASIMEEFKEYAA